MEFFEIGATIFGLLQGLLVMFNKRSNWIAYIVQMILMVIFSLSVNLYGYYDTGLIAQPSEYGYLVQQNSNETGQGTYLVLNNASNLVESELPKDLYYYETNQSTFNLYNLIYNNNLLNYKDARIKKLNISLTRTNEGYKNGNYTINFKTVDKKQINIDESSNNTFKFYSR